MPLLPKKKVGIVACSGEELPEGTVSRVAALKVLEALRPNDTVTICLPLFLAGGEGDRAFARFYPTVAIDGCEKRCAARATEMYSGKPAASIVVTDVVAGNGLGPIRGTRRLNEAGMQAADLVAQEVARLVDELLGRKREAEAEVEVAVEEPAAEAPEAPEDEEEAITLCSCGSGIPVQKVAINGRVVTLIALPAIFEQFYQAGKRPGNGTTRELLETTRIYNPIPPEEEAAYAEALAREYEKFCRKRAAHS
ncbi:MAG: putative zinc-binding protein [Thermoflexales bacterium]|nr:putative zinc-binding protein [Thermoflexales bacterium]